MSSPERIVPDGTEAGIVALHEQRYVFALPFCAGKDVLDAGCGVGYGSAILAGAARRVVGVDRSEEAIAYARKRYARANVEFVADDLQVLAQPDDSFDVVCSFETLEHLAEPEAHLEHVVRVLRPEGVYIVSTPQAAGRQHSPHHVSEFSREELRRLLGRYFDKVELYGQRRVQTRRHRLMQRVDVLGLRRRLPFLRRAGRVLLGTAPMAEVAGEEILISREGIDRASELVAVCRR